MERIVSRIKEYLDYKSIKPASAEKSIEVSNGSLSKAFNNGTEIKTDTLEKFLDIYTDINPSWLLYGKGSMLISDISIVAEPDAVYETPGSGEMEIVDDSLDPEPFVNKSGNKFLIYPDGRYTVEVLEVPFPAYASYLQAYTDEAMLAQEFGKTTF
ncbi:MAG TPA: hypothetical protein VEA37_12625, partial [Flavobacterium sp.]|nr:hypothetical protein [Flavobacterium sp.]